ncbi:hypothetical protein CapIbe_007313 [Capra ibex]
MPQGKHQLHSSPGQRSPKPALQIPSDAFYAREINHPARLSCPWDSPIKNTAVDCPDFLQGIFLIKN